MKISYRTTATGSGYVVLLDETQGANILSEFHPKFTSIFSKDAMFGQTSQMRRPQGNITCQLQLNWDQQYASRALALKSVRDMAALRNVSLHLKVEEGSETQYYPNATSDDFDSKLNGVSATHTGTFTTDEVTPTAPP